MPPTAPKKTRKDGELFSEMAVRTNAAILEYSRTSMSALAGSTAGIIGLTSLYGFAFYFLTSLILSVLLLTKTGKEWNKYFTSWTILLKHGLFGGLFTYVLFWTFLYGMVHVY